MRLQRVGRKNDPSYRIVVTDKRTGPKSNKHNAILGLYNPKLNQIELDTDAAKVWLAKGVQPSDTVHNILVAQKVIDAKKLNVLPKKSPIVDEEALKKAEEERVAAEEAAKAEKEAAAAEAEVPAEESAAEASAPATEEEAPAEPAPAAEAPDEAEATTESAEPAAEAVETEATADTTADETTTDDADSKKEA